MDTSRMPESMRRRYEERNARSVEEKARDFVRSFLSGAGDMDEVRADLGRVAATHRGSLQRQLTALDAFLASPMPEGTLAKIVGWDGNWVLDDPSDEGARAFLLRVADVLREVLSEAPPPTARRFRK